MRFASLCLDSSFLRSLADDRLRESLSLLWLSWLASGWSALVLGWRTKKELVGGHDR